MKYFGAHVSAAGGVENAPLNAAAIGADAFALFTKNQRQWSAPPLSEESVAAFQENCRKCGFAPENILLDPGFGFAKTPEQCWELLRDIEHIAPAGEILAGVSRKSFLGKLTGENIPAARSSETLAAELFLASKKVAVIRTHDVRSLSRALQVVRKIQGA